jgi:membrane protease YdiL (CAAX protease family)
LWLLLAWTAPTRHEAGVFFEHLLQIQPDYPLAICGVAWSGVDWSSGDGGKSEERRTEEIPAEEATKNTDALRKKSLARQTGELVSSIASAVGKPLRRITGELKPTDEVVDHNAEVEQPGDTTSTATPVDIKSPPGWDADIPPVVASTAKKSRSDWASEVKPSAAAVKPPVQSQQAEWLEPAAWSKEKESPDYPSLGDRGSGARIRGKQLTAGLSGIALAVFLGLYLLGIASAELVTAYRSHLLGLAYHGVLLILILIFAIFSSGSKNKKLLLALGLAPLIRLISLTMPQLNLDFPGSYAVIGVVVLIAAFLILHLAGFKPGQVGLTFGKFLPFQVVIGVAGIGLGFIEYLILRPEPLASNFSFPSILLPALVLFIFPGFTEELIFRGLMQRASTGISKRGGPVYIALLFTVLHIGYKSWLDLIFIFLVGLLFSILVEKTRSLVGVTLAHGLASICLFLVFPFMLVAPLQKLAFLPTPMAQVTGPAIWSAPFSQYSPPVEMITPISTSTATLTPMTIEPSSTPVPALTSSPTWTLTATWTSTPSSTSTPTKTGTPFIIVTRTPTSTSILQPTAHFTPTRTTTSIPYPTSTATPVPSPTLTPYLSPTPTPTKTPYPTDEPPPTEVPMYTPTATQP